MDACLECGVDYLDTANYEPEDTAKFEYSWQWAYRERFEKAGLTAVLGCGFDPGVTGVFSAYEHNWLYRGHAHVFKAFKMREIALPEGHKEPYALYNPVLVD